MTTIYELALTVRCPTCRAEPGVSCDAPRKRRASVSGPDDAHRRPHVTRQDRGVRATR